MSLHDQILQVQNSVSDLRQLYRQVEADGEAHAFKEAISKCIAEQPQHTLFLAWAYRLGRPDYACRHIHHPLARPTE